MQLEARPAAFTANLPRQEERGSPRARAVEGENQTREACGCRLCVLHLLSQPPRQTQAPPFRHCFSLSTPSSLTDSGSHHFHFGLVTSECLPISYRGACPHLSPQLPQVSLDLLGRD